MSTTTPPRRVYRVWRLLTEEPRSFSTVPYKYAQSAGFGYPRICFRYQETFKHKVGLCAASEALNGGFQITTEIY
jgi:hypothetical protein